jgi:predicted GNAT family acetyltransferase
MIGTIILAGYQIVFMEETKLELNQHGDGAFYLYRDGNVIAKMLVGVMDNSMSVYHTEALIEGKGYGKKIFDAMVDHARKIDLKVTAYCPFVHGQFKKHTEQYTDIWSRKKEV